MLRFSKSKADVHPIRFRNLNTSYVKVQLSSKFPMIQSLKNLNTSYVKVQQSIRCSESISHCHLNTSYVKVQLGIGQKTQVFMYHLNTSYVKVQHFKLRPNPYMSALFKYILC